MAPPASLCTLLRTTEMYKLVPPEFCWLHNGKMDQCHQSYVANLDGTIGACKFNQQSMKCIMSDEFTRCDNQPRNQPPEPPPSPQPNVLLSQPLPLPALGSGLAPRLPPPSMPSATIGHMLVRSAVDNLPENASDTNSAAAGGPEEEESLLLVVSVALLMLLLLAVSLVLASKIIFSPLPFSGASKANKTKLDSPSASSTKYNQLEKFATLETAAARANVDPEVIAEGDGLKVLDQVMERQAAACWGNFEAQEMPVNKGRRYGALASEPSIPCCVAERAASVAHSLAPGGPPTATKLIHVASWQQALAGTVKPNEDRDDDLSSVVSTVRTGPESHTAMNLRLSGIAPAAGPTSLSHSKPASLILNLKSKSRTSSPRWTRGTRSPSPCSLKDSKMSMSLLNQTIQDQLPAQMEHPP